MKYILVVWMLSGETVTLTKANEYQCQKDKASLSLSQANIAEMECMPADMVVSIETIKKHTEKDSEQI